MTVQHIPVHDIIPGNNDRTVFDQSALLELAASIRQYGLAQPITVRPVEQCTECGAIYLESETPEQCTSCGYDGFQSFYQIVAGERRFRAIQLLDLDTVPALVRTLDDEAASAIMLAENVARQDLDPIDEALAYKRRMDDFGWSVQDCADKAGVSATLVRFRLKLLRLRPDIQHLVRNGHLAIGYAQALSDANLDSNRQLIALSRLRNNPSPTPQWFRHEVGALLQEQAQEPLFDTALFFIEPKPEPETAVIEPAHPSTTVPDIDAETPKQTLARHIQFWKQAAREWNALGKPFKRQECEAAAQAIEAVSSAI